MRLQRGRVQRGDKGRGRICLVAAVGGGGAPDFADKFARFGLNLFLLVLGISDLPQFKKKKRDRRWICRLWPA